jgi:hypothetical protein
LARFELMNLGSNGKHAYHYTTKVTCWSEEEVHLGKSPLTVTLRNLYIQSVAQTDKIFRYCWSLLSRPECFMFHVSPCRLTDCKYWDFLEKKLSSLLNEVPVVVREWKWFTCDGTPPQFRLVTQGVLNNIYCNRCIGWGGPTAWAPCSADFNPVDFMWGHLKDLVYSAPVNSMQTLQQRTVNGCHAIHNNLASLNILTVNNMTCPGMYWISQRTLSAPLVNVSEGW